MCACISEKISSMVSRLAFLYLIFQPSLPRSQWASPPTRINATIKKNKENRQKPLSWCTAGQPASIFI